MECHDYFGTPLDYMVTITSSYSTTTSTVLCPLLLFLLNCIGSFPRGPYRCLKPFLVQFFKWFFYTSTRVPTSQVFGLYSFSFTNDFLTSIIYWCLLRPLLSLPHLDFFGSSEVEKLSKLKLPYTYLCLWSVVIS